MLKIKGLYLPMLANRIVTGDVRWVDSSHSNSNDSPSHGKDPEKPFNSIDYAIGQCTASNDDLIIVGSGHTETISAAGDITMDVAGVSVVGLGRGLNRPTITYDTADTAIILVTAANCSLENLIFNANLADVASAIDVDALDFLVKDCLFKEQTTNMNFLSCINTDDTNNAADGLSVIGCERVCIDAEALAFVSILGNCNRLKLIDNNVQTASATDIGHFLIMSSKVCLAAEIVGNYLDVTGDNNAQTVGIFMTGSSSTSTGIVAYNLVASLDTTTELLATATLDFRFFENYYTGTIAKSGKLWPAADAA